MTDQYRFLRFLLVGIVNTGVGYLLFAAMLLASLSALAAAAAATALGALFNFGSIGIVVFRQADPGLLPRFLGVYIVQYGVNAAGLMLLSHFGYGPLMAQALLVPLLAVGTYVAMRRWVFRGARA
ncbi:MAG: GtrA family protein [Sphingopyxis sp.]|nr:GtrA family protein [Sphingopyxis sp.]